MKREAPTSYEALCQTSPHTLEDLLRQGTQPKLENLVGWEFRGFNTSPMSELIRARKFKKGFQRETANSGVLYGYNVRCKQNGLLNPWVEKLKYGEPIREFPFFAYAVRPEEEDHLYPNALLLNYGLPSKLFIDASSRLRDYVVHPYADNTDLLLGKAFGALGHLRLSLGFFVAERYNRGL